ncbi:DsbA family protein [Pseudomaricurvus alkylphenolicus]|uniref:DsbA family protein n=1 Tax=Pseudomaricurvus alkylphenolicus TaxID=1306991 RepID=UPI001423FFCD|nr:DsbA family protein [Pseudomaricurvus alkylphenolicus]NIB43498.1 DsbA family protein [Pseudomaricurvus alkylphenolicus]
MTATLYYVHDPMCSWCWAFRPVWDQVKQALPTAVKIENVTGGLARDCDNPMPMEMQQTIQGYWREIQAQLGTEFNFDFWTLNQPRRSTYLSCRATIAAGMQSTEPATGQDRMIDAIQRAYYLRAMNPSETSVLVQLSKELGLDPLRFEKDLCSESVESEFRRQHRLARQLPIDGFPSLVLKTETQTKRLVREYQHPQTIVQDLLSSLE